jgi:hypothetical protein
VYTPPPPSRPAPAATLPAPQNRPPTVRARCEPCTVEVGKTSTVTGNISYTRQLTSKTTVALAAFRNIESYVAGANSEVGTGANVDVRWSPDSKFTFDLTGGYEHDAIEGGLAIANAFDRSDRIKFVKLDLKYAVLSWLEVHPHVSYQDRASSLAIANYSSTVVGIKVIGRLE